jgi:hypothetical protein
LPWTIACPASIGALPALTSASTGALAATRMITGWLGSGCPGS